MYLYHLLLQHCDLHCQLHTECGDHPCKHLYPFLVLLLHFIQIVLLQHKNMKNRVSEEYLSGIMKQNGDEFALPVLSELEQVWLLEVLLA